MFTGIVQAVGKVDSIEHVKWGARFVIDPCGWSHGARKGDSICVNGCCLTYAPPKDERPEKLCFDIMLQTLRKTTLGDLTHEKRVNLEPALTVGDRMGGHFVQGHIDAIATVHQIEKERGDYKVWLKTDEKAMRFTVPQGSVALDGVSLTVADVKPMENRFCVALIPTTLHDTTLSDWKAGTKVNLETDMIVRASAHYVFMTTRRD